MTTTTCPCCGRRHRARHRPAPRGHDDLPLFAWVPRPVARRTTGARVVLRDDLRDAEGEPRACIVMPGRRVPLAFPSIPAALAALARMEAAHAGR